MFRRVRGILLFKSYINFLKEKIMKRLWEKIYHSNLSFEIFIDGLHLSFLNKKLKWLKVKMFFLIKSRDLLRFIASTLAYFRLYREGFNIEYSKIDGYFAELEIYRFYWKEQAIKDMADIDCVDGHYNTVYNGSYKNLC